MAFISAKHGCRGLAGGARNVPRLRERVARSAPTAGTTTGHRVAWVHPVRAAAADDQGVAAETQRSPASEPAPEPALDAPAAAAPAAANTVLSTSSSTSANGGGGGQEAWQPSAVRTARRVERLKVSLLAALSSLDRGLAANAREAAEVDELCSQLEGLGGPVALAAPAAGGQQGSAAASSSSGSSAPSDLLAGTWRLVYSSGFNSGSLGGRRPGPPAAGFPATLGQVYQRIDPSTSKLDNIVELLLSPPPPLA